MNVLRPEGPREQQESAFSLILSGLVARMAGARAAALVDREGETVDYAGGLDPFAMRVAAAHWRIVLDETKAGRSLHDARWIALRAARASYLVHELPEGYALVVELARAAGFDWRRAVASCAHALGHEAGWTRQGDPWFHVEVASDARHRPESLRTPSGERPIEILGALAGGLGPPRTGLARSVRYRDRGDTRSREGRRLVLRRARRADLHSGTQTPSSPFKTNSLTGRGRRLLCAAHPVRLVFHQAGQVEEFRDLPCRSCG